MRVVVQRYHHFWIYIYDIFHFNDNGSEKVAEICATSISSGLPASLYALKVISPAKSPSLDETDDALSFKNINSLQVASSDAFFNGTDEYWGTSSSSAVNFASGITAFTSSGLSGTVNLSLFTDGSTSNNAFHTDSSGVGSYFRIDLGQQRTITDIRINTRSGNVNSVNWQIQGSNDDSSFTDTGYELSETYDYLDKLKTRLDKPIKYISPTNSFDYYLKKYIDLNHKILKPIAP